MTDLRVHVQRLGGILIGRGHKTPAALGSAAAVEASAACSGSAEAVLRWAQRSAASLGSALSRLCWQFTVRLSRRRWRGLA